jgi:hypothetical protein
VLLLCNLCCCFVLLLALLTVLPTASHCVCLLVNLAEWVHVNVEPDVAQVGHVINLNSAKPAAAAAAAAAAVAKVAAEVYPTMLLGLRFPVATQGANSWSCQPGT